MLEGREYLGVVVVVIVVPRHVGRGLLRKLDEVGLIVDQLCAEPRLLALLVAPAGVGAVIARR